MSDAVSVIGAGGHAKVVIAAAQAAGMRVTGLHDDRTDLHGTTVLGVLIVGAIARVRGRAVIAVGDNRVRQRLAAELPAVEWVTVVHPRAWVHGSVQLGPGTVVFAGAVLQPDTVVGRHAIINTGATVDHDCVIGDFAHVAPGAHLSGNTTLGEGAFLGTGAATRQGVRVGAWTTVGVGGVVVADLSDGIVAVGVPARPHP